MPSSRIPKLTIHKASGQYRVRIAGKDHYLGTDQRAARKRYNAVIAAHLASKPIVARDPHSITLAELADHYKADRIRAGTWSPVYKAVMTKLSKSKHWLLPATMFGPQAMQEVIDANRDNYSAHTLRTTLGITRHMFRRGVAMGLIPPEALTMLHSASARELRIPTPSAEPRPISDEVVNATIAHCERESDRDMIRLQRLTGMRSGELVRMRWAEIDTSEAVWVYKPSKHKGASRGKKRSIYLGPKAQRILMKYRDCDPMWMGPRRPRSVSSYGKMVEAVCERAGLEHWTPHQLRHSRLSEVRRQAGLDASQVIGGHATITVTQNYAERQDALGRRVAKETG